jgi:hypothetical protein
MARCIINSVRAVPDAVDRLMWDVDVRTDFYISTFQLGYALFWEGHVVFWRESVPAGSMPGPQTPRMTLPARWMNRDTAARFTAPQERRFEFAADLPGTALDRIEDFRGGGRLYARLEGKLAVIFVEPPRQGGDLVGPMLLELGRTLVDSGREHAATVCSDPKELSRDTWCDEVLAKLRPQGRHVLEVTVPIGAAAGDAAAAALQHQRAAQRSFDGGRYDEAVRDCARALEHTTSLLDRAEASYGRSGRERIADQIKTTKSLCDPAPLAEKVNQGRHRVDRALAHHVLIATSSLLGLATS